MTHKIQLIQTSRLPSSPNVTERFPFSTLWSPVEGVIAVDVVRKPTYTDRYLDFNSHHDSQRKVSTASTPLHRALNLPNSFEGKKRNLIMFMQLWSPTVIHLSLSKTYRLKKPDPQQQVYPQRNLLECFSRWLNQPN